MTGPDKFLCYAVNEFAQTIRAARMERRWMSDFVGRHPYRCLPLNIANSYGWEILCPLSVEVEWDGGPLVENVRVRALDAGDAHYPLDRFCVSNFAQGIVTFHVDYIFRTPPGWDLVAAGPANWPRENAAPLMGIIEADWLPYTFTMNYRMLRPGVQRWQEGEPYCVVYPIRKNVLNDTVPEIRRLADDPVLSAEHAAFKNARDEFMTRWRAKDPATLKQAWQRFYFMGRHPDGTAVENHVLKLRLNEPVDTREGLEAAPAADSASPPAGAPLWHRSSVLNDIDDEQSPRNAAGRARIDREGRLHPGPDTRYVRSAADAAGLDFLCVEDVMSGRDCDQVAAAFDALRTLVVQEDRSDPYWNDRYLWGRDIAAQRPDAAARMLEAIHNARELLAWFYRLEAPIYNDLFQLVQWKNGVFMPPHADRAYPDGRPHGMQHRSFGGILYLSDDYEGGELYFTALDIVVKPKRGMFLGFTGGFHHEHAVTRVESGGLRLTMPTFYTFDARRADVSVHPGVAASAKLSTSES